MRTNHIVSHGLVTGAITGRPAVRRFAQHAGTALGYNALLHGSGLPDASRGDNGEPRVIWPHRTREEVKAAQQGLFNEKTLVYGAEARHHTRCRLRRIVDATQRR